MYSMIVIRPDRFGSSSPSSSSSSPPPPPPPAPPALATPTPVSAMSIGSSSMVSVPVRVPVAVGQNVTVTGQVALGASNVGQSFVWAKSEAPAVMLIDSMVAGTVPVLVTTTVSGSLVVPTMTVPKSMLVRSTLMPAVATMVMVVASLGVIGSNVVVVAVAVLVMLLSARVPGLTLTTMVNVAVAPAGRVPIVQVTVPVPLSVPSAPARSVTTSAPSGGSGRCCIGLDVLAGTDFQFASTAVRYSAGSVIHPVPRNPSDVAVGGTGPIYRGARAGWATVIQSSGLCPYRTNTFNCDETGWTARRRRFRRLDRRVFWGPFRTIGQVYDKSTPNPSL
jgi:hypothetical protein